jgi:hypothetical protein
MRSWPGPGSTVTCPNACTDQGAGKEAVKVYSLRSEVYKSVARLLLLQDAQAGIGESSLEGLPTEIRKYNLGGFLEKTITTVGRQKKYLQVLYDKGVLHVLPPWHPLARLYLEEANKADQAGVDAMIMRRRSHVWITRVRQKAKAINRACFACRRQAKRLGEQKMAPLPAHRMEPTSPFWSTGVNVNISVVTYFVATNVLLAPIFCRHQYFCFCLR